MLCILNELLTSKDTCCTQKHLHFNFSFTTLRSFCKVLNVSQRFLHIVWKEANAFTSKQHLSSCTSESGMRDIWPVSSPWLHCPGLVTTAKRLDRTVYNGVCYRFGEEATDGQLFGPGLFFFPEVFSFTQPLIHGSSSSLRTFSTPPKVQVLSMAS